MIIKTLPSNRPAAIYLQPSRPSGFRFGCGCAIGVLAAIAALATAIFLLWGRGLAKSAERDNAERDAFENARRRDANAADASAKQTADAANHTLDWHIQRFDDSMDDSVWYVFSLPGLKVDNGLASYRPRLVLQFKPTALTRSTGAIDYTVDVAVSVGSEGVSLTRREIEYRIGRRPAKKAPCVVSSGNDAVFLPDGTLRDLEHANTLVVRVDTMLGGVRTFQFDISGFRVRDVESELRRRIETDRPLGVRIIE